MASGGGGNIKVVVRVRPFNSREKDRKAKCIVQMKGDQTILVPAAIADPKAKNNKAALEGTKTFAFDRSYWSFEKSDPNYAGQDDLHADLGKPLLENAFGGYNNCIFAYGQTGSGKSYSMMGYGQEEGVIPKICRDMFDRIAYVQQRDPNLACTVEVSYLEIYNERVRDLLNPSTKGNLKVREHPSTGPYVEDLAKLAVRSFSEIEHLMDEGNKARTVAATNMNETSSRSHAVFTLTLSQRRRDVDTGMDTEKAAKISLVDLAGSERAQSTGATGARLKEGAEINRSLSTLGRVIAALADLSSGKLGGKKKNPNMVPYRDSILTWLLKDSLGGNSMTAMIAAISPADINFEETLSTLRYADSAKRIKNHAVVNEDANARMIRELKEELAQLRSKLTTGGGAVGSDGGIEPEQYPADTPLEKQMVSITGADGAVKKVSKAEIAEQLSQSEKLYQDLNQTWEQKLEKTEQIHKEREAALEELGISIEKGFVGLSTPKKMPHLVNLSDDPLLAECLIYNLKPGTTTVGNVETATTAEIRLNGSKILHDHCVFENVDGIVTVLPKENAAVMVNGQAVSQPKRLRSGYRIILGDFHIFRFNHPEEARAERAEQGSLLKHSMTADEIGDPNSPSVRAHDRSLSNLSRFDVDLDAASSGAASPGPGRFGTRESDWDIARREAVSAVLGSDQRINTLTDDELDVLFEDLQKVRAVRKARPESRLFEMIDDDNDSDTSFPIRDKYLSGGTLDNFSLDTAITMPSTPQNGDDDDRLRGAKEDMQTQLEKQKEDYQTKLQAQDGNVESEQIREERVRMEENLKTVKEDMERQLQAQKEQYDKQIEEIRKTAIEPIDRKTGLTQKQLFLVRSALHHWRQQRYVAMAAAVLQNAATLKEAQIMSRQMDKDVTFQFTVADPGHTYGSSYDLVLSDISSEDDPALDTSRKPCVAVRVIDFKHNVVHLWSIQKLRARVRLMRQLYQYLDRPEYIKHFRLENPFSESCLPQYTRVGDADIPLTAVLECRVQDFTLDVYSPYTNTVIGIVRLALEPSSAEAPSSTLKFNVVMHDFVGFAEREGTEVHAMLFFPGISEEDGATCTQMVSGFDEGPVRFDSVHSMSLLLSSPRDSSLRVTMFARVTPMHLDKLLSWDDMRDSAPSAARPKLVRQGSRIPEHEFYNEERHDVFARIQVLEIGENGSYQPVEVVQKGVLDPGTYQLRQGLQRRIVIELTHTSGSTLPWHDINSLRIGNLHLMDASGHVPDLSSEQADVPLSIISPPIIRTNADNSTNIRILVHWDSSAHGSLLLDRPTSDNYHIKMSLMWSMASTKLAEPLEFSMDLAVQMRSRSYMRHSNVFAQIFSTSRVVHSTSGIFSLSVKPIPSKRSGDLWRLSTSEAYVKGEEMLQGWAPRGVSLIHDFIDTRKRKWKMAEIEAARGALGAETLSFEPDEESVQKTDEALDERQQNLIRKILGLWELKPDISERILNKDNTDAPAEGAAFAANGTTGAATSLSLGTSHFVPKNPDMIKSGYLLTPDPTSTRWARRYLELRKPYLHIHTADGDEINILNLSDARIDHAPKIAKLLRRDGQGKAQAATQHVFAVYGVTKAWIFATKSDREKSEWIFAIDQSYYSSRGDTPEDDDDDW